MAKLSDYQSGRNDGLQLALKIIKEGGQQALEQEIKFHGARGINTSLAVKELDIASQKIKEMTLDTVIVMTIAVLHDEFGFGQTRCQRFMDRFELKSGCLVDGLATWDEYAEYDDGCSRGKRKEGFKADTDRKSCNRHL